MSNLKYKIFSYGYQSYWIRQYLNNIIDHEIFDAKHFLVGEKNYIKKICEDNQNLILVNTSNVENHITDYKLLSKLEKISKRTISSIIFGDRVLKHRDYNISIKYLSFIATNFIENSNLYKPCLVLGAKDNANAVIVNMCCKLLNIPWIFAYYFAIPPDRVAYINDLYPGSIYKMPDNQNKISLKECGDIIKKFRNRKLTALYAPLGSSFLNNIKCYSHNLIKRISNKVEYNPYAFPTVKERIIDLTCRFKNRVKYPYKYLLKDYPKSKYIFFTLHVYPEATIDVYAPIFNNQFALLDQISKSIPCTHKLIIKAHFVDPFTWERKEIINLINKKNVYFCNPYMDSYELIKNADLVITIHGSSALEASLLGIPSIMFGESPFKVFSTCKRSWNVEDLYTLIIDCLKIKKPKQKNVISEFQEFLSKSEKVFDYHFDQERKLEFNEIEKWKIYLTQVIMNQIKNSI